MRAFAKVNLSLRVAARDSSGFHPIRSLAQSVGWFDELALAWAETEDVFEVTGPVAANEDNLAWRALAAVREQLGDERPVTLRLEKQIAVAAGLGGGSADAAATLIGAFELYGGDADRAAELAPDLGSDVPFSLVGGTALVEGRGERINPLPPLSGFALGIVVPPFELKAGAVYDRWDHLGGPAGPEAGGRDLPPGLRDLGPVANDLLPAALDLRPDLGDWIADVSRAWERPAHLTGSGPGLFGLFADVEEAAAAISQVEGARATWAGEMVERGWEKDDASG